MAKKAVVVLALMERKGVEYKLITPQALKWMYTPFNRDNGMSYDDPIPKSVLKSFITSGLASQSELDETESIHVTIGSCDNDRALGLPGELFYSLKDMLSYIVKNELIVKDEYYGHVY